MALGGESDSVRSRAVIHTLLTRIQWMDRRGTLSNGASQLLAARTVSHWAGSARQQIIKFRCSSSSRQKRTLAWSVLGCEIGQQNYLANLLSPRLRSPTPKPHTRGRRPFVSSHTRSVLPTDRRPIWIASAACPPDSPSPETDTRHSLDDSVHHPQHRAPRGPPSTHSLAPLPSIDRDQIILRAP